MGKHHFTLKHNSKTYRSYLDEAGEVWVFDTMGLARTNWKSKPILEIREAREVALDIIRELKL